MDQLNSKQNVAVHSEDENVLIIAPAGSGKTTTLVAALRKYKEENPMTRAVAITFTVKAANDLKTKLLGCGGVDVSTIHSWAYSELESLSKKVRAKDFNNGFKIKLLQEERIKEILEELCKKRNYYYIKVGIIYSYVMGNFNMDIRESTKMMFQAVHRDYIEYKQQYGLYDFTDLPQYLLDKLDDYDESINDIDGFFVDEFQDVDDVQLQLFSRVMATKKFYIGDPQQAIYMFRGATEDVVDKINWFKLYELDVNYRSNQEIIDFATSFKDKAQYENVSFAAQLESYKSSIYCENGSGGNVHIINRAGVAYKVNEFIKSNGYELIGKLMEDQPMILCRKNKEVRAIKAIGYDRVQTVHQAKGLEYPKVIVTDFEIRGLEDINIAYVAMTRAETDLVAAEYNAFIKILERLKLHGRLPNNDLF